MVMGHSSRISRLLRERRRRLEPVLLEWVWLRPSKVRKPVVIIWLDAQTAYQNEVNQKIQQMNLDELVNYIEQPNSSKKKTSKKQKTKKTKPNCKDS